jgi:serine phosphatase RsbU (regulator of sigma subunit)
MPIGHSLEKTKSFTETKIQLEDGDQVYLFSDGYVDQFGGEFGKKLKYRRFRSLIVKSAELNTPEQKLFLEDAFHKWRGNHDQIDDVCIMGIKV